MTGAICVVQFSNWSANGQEMSWTLNVNSTGAKYVYPYYMMWVNGNPSDIYIASNSTKGLRLPRKWIYIYDGSNYMCQGPSQANGGIYSYNDYFDN